MRLLVISNMAHYRRSDGVVVGHGATVRELDALSSLFGQVRHIACLHTESPPESALPYQASNLTLVPVPPAGGETITSKLQIVARIPQYSATIWRELRDADAVHVRCPANVSMCALAALEITRKPRRRWIKYAGNWWPYPQEPASYALQRRWLARPELGAVVTVNGMRSGLPPHVHAFINPCLTDDELVAGVTAATTKSLSAPVRLLFVGNLATAKNPQAVIEVVDLLVKEGIDATLDLVGDGPEMASLRAHIGAAHLSDRVRLHGALPRPNVGALYASAHFVILPSRTEGWPKVLSEGMAAGAVPLATAVGSIPETLQAIGAGRAIAGEANPREFADAIRGYCLDPQRWRQESERAVAAAPRFSYSSYVCAVRSLLQLRS